MQPRRGSPAQLPLADGRCVIPVAVVVPLGDARPHFGWFLRLPFVFLGLKLTSSATASEWSLGRSGSLCIVQGRIDTAQETVRVAPHLKRVDTNALAHCNPQVLCTLRMATHAADTQESHIRKQRIAARTSWRLVRRPLPFPAPGAVALMPPTDAEAQQRTGTDSVHQAASR